MEGTLLKRRIDVYEQIFKKVEMLRQMEVIPHAVLEAAVHLRETSEADLAYSSQNQFFRVFSSPSVLKEEFLSIEEFLATKRIYFDEGVDLQATRFINYFATLRRLQVMYEAEFVNRNISLDNNSAAGRIEQLLTVQIGMVLQDEFNDQIEKLMLQLKQSMQNLSFSKRPKINHTYSYYNSPDEPVMGDMKDAILFTKNQEITTRVTECVAAGMAGDMIAKKKKK